VVGAAVTVGERLLGRPIVVPVHPAAAEPLFCEHVQVEVGNPGQRVFLAVTTVGFAAASICCSLAAAAFVGASGAASTLADTCIHVSSWGRPVLGGPRRAFGAGIRHVCGIIALVCSTAAGRAS